MDVAELLIRENDTDDFRADPLWEAICDFPLDDECDLLPFSVLVARENRWSHEFTCRVIDEYRRYCYLARRASHPVSPSDEIDQVWHQHILRTENYKEDFCGDVLGRFLHHRPSKGGIAEYRKHRSWYEMTLRSYEEIFATAPPPDIWPPVNDRFRDLGAFHRISTADNWVIPKPRPWQWLATLISHKRES